MGELMGLDYAFFLLYGGAVDLNVQKKAVNAACFVHFVGEKH